MSGVDADEIQLTERQKSVLWRYEEARRYGLTRLEARLYADSEIDCSELRKLKDARCPPAMAVKILFGP